MKKFIFTSLSFLLTYYQPAVAQEYSPLCGGADISAKSFSFDLPGSLEEETVSVDRYEQERRILECAPGSSKCFEQFAGNPNGQFLLSYEINGDTGRDKPEVLKTNIKSKDFTNAKLVACLNSYWKSITFPSPRNGSILGSAKLMVRVQKSKGDLASTSLVGSSAVEKAVSAAGIRKSDSLETKIDKALWLLNEKRYFYPLKPGPLAPPFDIPYQLDSLRTPEQILETKVGGSCGSSALAFAAILKASGIDSKDLQIVNAVVNKDLGIICPKAGLPRVQNAQSGAPGHVFVAIRFPGGKWKIINSIGGSRTYERADWYSPEEVRQRLKETALAVPKPAFKTLPESTFGSGLTVFQSWSLEEVQMHTYEQRYDLIASGNLTQKPAICRFTAPK